MQKSLCSKNFTTKFKYNTQKKLSMELTCQGFLLPKHKDVVNQPKSSTEEGRCDSTISFWPKASPNHLVT